MTDRATPARPDAPVSPWGDFDVAEGGTGFWHIGPLQLWIVNRTREWRVYHLAGDDPLERSQRVVLNSDTTPPGDATLTRFSFAKEGTRLTLRPVLADRAVVVQPDTPLYIPSNEETTMYVSTPAWVRVSLPRAGTLLELPSHRPSDTWFGPNTLVGELCYASRTAGRLSLAELAYRPHRVITPIRVKNRAHNVLVLEKVKLPVRYLAVYGTPGQLLWTPRVTLEREEDGDLAGLEVSHGAPTEAGAVDKLGEARQHPERNLVVRAFSRLFNLE